LCSIKPEQQFDATRDQFMRLLLGSGGLGMPDRLATWTSQLRSFLGPTRRVLFVPYALADHDGYLVGLIDRGLNAGYELDGIHRYPDPLRAVEEAEAIFVGGGNTFRLLHRLYQFALLEAIRQRVRAGMAYIGISAGTNVACPTIKTTNDMPIVQPPSLAALGLVPFQVNPHYFCGETLIKQGDLLVEHRGETRDERLREFHEENDTPVVGLWEGGILRLEEGRWSLIGAPARLFRKGAAPVDLMPGENLQLTVG
jgi:dipeptidase E